MQQPQVQLYPGVQPTPVQLTQPVPSTDVYPPVNMNQKVGNYPGAAYAVTFPDGMEILKNLNSVWIQQRPQYLESLGCCEIENVYSIFNGKDAEDKEKLKCEDGALFRCKEQSSCCQRQCCTSAVRAFHMEISYKRVQFDSASQSYMQNWAPFLRLERDYKCTCFCLNRPVIKIVRVDQGKDQIIGYVIDRWACCDFVYDLTNELKDSPLYTIKATCCQCGLFFRCPCSPCERVNFPIFENKSKGQIGNLANVWPGCAKVCCSDADNYSATFPLSMIPEHKIMILAAAILIDYRYFEKSPAGN